MAAFQFRLEKVLSLRFRERDQATLRHAEAKAYLDEAQGRLDTLRNDLQQALEGLDDQKRSGSVTAELLHLHTLHHDGMNHAIARTTQEVASANEEANRTAEELMELHRATEVLEKLKQQELDNWQRAQAKREANELDEIAVIRYKSGEE